MQILHTLSGPNLGGLEFRVLDQARWLREQGHAVAIAAPPQSETLKLARSWGLAAIGMDFNSPYSWSGMLRLRQIVRDLRIQVIDAHGTPDAKASALCRDLCSLVRTWHFSRPLRTSWRRRLEWRLGCHRVITTSEGGARDIVAAGFAQRDRISVVGEWADHGFFVAADKLALRHAARQELAIDPAAFVVATIGMLRPDKRQEDLLRVVHLLRQRGLPARALVVGAPTRATAAYCQQLHDLAAELGIGDHVTFAGHREDIRSVIHAADAVLVPSINEAWSRVVPEAYASRCPVVASAVGGLPEIVHPGSTGWLAPAADVAGFADHLAWIWSHPGEAARIAEQARTFADRHLMLSQKMAETLSAYEAAMTHAGAVRNVEATA
ncbi:glycosyltransferase family 4 protein [Achromobacter ruhlandii]|uniref:D-inositol 3-phosphate glycosyltransferase n=1 Tax=Achromobacter ruhlandii TaxID=72557 RepID=A0ABM8LS60_9BURK|nr:glycosyltransferase family 4 protein [Achromobacter ruhlandii]AKP91355.1 Putative lipopolysaccharide biosynthesis-related glycosyltransferase [Achromobacter xylosoxidans]MDC6087925.1 glycosyltransferase family 4 protein [Achromobacter ruhlandii]MDC6154064.1 glycosyltransferase family 4 protein [Achromobacter ruhlandii]WIW01443.1 glycosyltransferase family 4 protein [Achromobacter ruhlandii]CAB3945491.1 D-inositol 3-phosphate glycosyltransferase [Achromobacter ruhlandii]